MPIIYEVDRIRDGKSFTTRRVVAIQHGQAIFTMAVSFHRDEAGLEHQATMPDVPTPEELPSEAELKERVLPMMPEPVRRYYERERPIELRPVEFDRYLGKKLDDGALQRLDPRHRPAAGRSGDPPLRARLCLRHDAARHRADPARPHACSTRPSWRRASTMRSGFTGRSAPTSGCSTRRTAPTCAGARGFSRGLIFARDGTLVASVAQEGLLRERRADQESRRADAFGSCWLTTALLS